MKVVCALVYIFVGVWFNSQATRFFYAAQPLPKLPPEVLLLRSFEDDDAIVGDGSVDGFKRDLGISEESLVRGMPIANVIVAFFEIASGMIWSGEQPLLSIVGSSLRRRAGIVGNPKETLPSWSADWYYYDNSKWQDSVLKMMFKAKLIIIIVGTTESVSWEIQQLFALRYLTKTLFLIPPPSLYSDDEEFMEETAENDDIIERSKDVEIRVSVLASSAKKAGYVLLAKDQINKATIAFTCAEDGVVERVWNHTNLNYSSEYQLIIQNRFENLCEAQHSKI